MKQSHAAFLQGFFSTLKTEAIFFTKTLLDWHYVQEDRTPLSSKLPAAQ
jgi:hypothetical protein